MTSYLLSCWLTRFNSYIAKTVGRSALLLLDNCSAHNCEKTIAELSHVRVCSLPPNTTSVMQFMDAGVISALKRSCKRRQMMRVVDLVDKNKSSIYNVDVWTAMDWIKEEWDAIESRKILYCWLHTNKS